jgi:formylglycine-generating enzyme required for sulfatase activity
VLSERDDGGFDLAVESDRIRVGEPLIYPHRGDAAHDSARLPVAAVSPADAEAYARWLDATGRLPGARLCTELEWERLARGADGRRFPSGPAIDPARDANLGEDGADPRQLGPDQVGRHPATRSLFGADDLVGNVMDITRSSFGVTAYVARGGAFAFNEVIADAYDRETLDATTRASVVGVRVCTSIESFEEDPR